jgi:hypothetical protein
MVFMDSNDWTIYNGLMPAIEYDPVTQHIVFNAALLQLFNLPSSTSLPQFLEVITPLLWQQVCQLKNGLKRSNWWPLRRCHGATLPYSLADIKGSIKLTN